MPLLTISLERFVVDKSKEVHYTKQDSCCFSVAEIAEKPLYRVTCGDLGTRATDVEKYMQTVLYLGKIWNCGESIWLFREIGTS